MKFAIITDQHFGARKGSKIFHDYFKLFYENIFFPTIEKENIKCIIDMGDTFDNRKSIDFWSLEWAKKNYYDKLRSLGVTVYSIVGNHTSYYKNTNNLNAINTLLAEYDNVVCVSNPSDLNVFGLNILMIPWINNDNIQESLNVITSSTSKIAMGHLELNGFVAHRGHVQETGMDPKIFKKFDKVFSGHYHTRSDDGKIFYLGNPYEIYWNDYNDIRGFHLFDSETLELNPVNNPYKMFMKIDYSDTEIKGFDFESFKEKIVKVVITKKTDSKNLEQFLDCLYKVGVHELKIIENYDIDLDTNFDENEKFEDTISILNGYVESIESNLNKSKIKDIIHSVYKEACEMV